MHPSSLPRPSKAISTALFIAALTGPVSTHTASAGGGSTITVSLLPVRTNTLYEDADGHLSGGHSPSIFAGNTATNLRRRALLAFDLTGQIPAEGTLQSASLVLTCEQSVSGGVPVTLHRVTADWGSGNSTPFPPGGAGAPAELGDATWLHRFYDPSLQDGGLQRWSTAGGDFDAAALATTSVADAGVAYSWTSTALTALVASWSVDASANHGLVVVGDESTLATAKRFDSELSDNVSARAHLVLTVALAPPHCVADLGEAGGGFGHDGVLDNNDFISFITLFFAQSPLADLGEAGGLSGSDGQWDNNDFIAFINAFFNGTGCV